MGGAAPDFNHRRSPRWAVGRRLRPEAPVLPPGFLAQVRALTGASTLHIPVCLRERMGAAFADCVEGLLDDDLTWAALCEAFSALVLHGVPYGVSNVVELEQRMAMWEAWDLQGLLGRVGTQAAGGATGTANRTESERRAAC